MGISYDELAGGLERTLKPFFEKRKAKGIKMVSSWSDIIDKLCENDEEGLKGKKGMVLFASDRNNLYYIYDNAGRKTQIVILRLPFTSTREVMRLDI